MNSLPSHIALCPTGPMSGGCGRDAECAVRGPCRRARETERCGPLSGCAAANPSPETLQVCREIRREFPPIRYVDCKIHGVEFCKRHVVFSFRHVDRAGNVQNLRNDMPNARNDMSIFRNDMSIFQNNMSIFRIDIKNPGIDIPEAQIDMSLFRIDMSNRRNHMSNARIDVPNPQNDMSIRAPLRRIGKNGFLFFGSKPRNFAGKRQILRQSADKGPAQTGHDTAQLCPSKHPDGFCEALG
jgi:hypothetical protein